MEPWILNSNIFYTNVPNKNTLMWRMQWGAHNEFLVIFEGSLIALKIQIIWKVPLFKIQFWEFYDFLNYHLMQDGFSTLCFTLPSNFVIFRNRWLLVSQFWNSASLWNLKISEKMKATWALVGHTSTPLQNSILDVHMSEKRY